jgi:hypothetical protein
MLKMVYFFTRRQFGKVATPAALDYATELTSNKQVDPGTFARLRDFYSEREICDIVWLVASEHLYNVSNIGLNIGSDGLCQLSPPLASSSPESRAPPADAAS